MEALILQVTVFSYEIIVIDNNSDGIEMLKSRPHYDRVIWLTSDIRNPYTSRNIGIKASKGRVLAFLDAKCKTTDDWIETGFSYMNKENCKILAGHYDVVPASDDNKDLLYSLLYLNNEKNVKYNYGVTTGHLWVQKSVFDKIGLFDESHISGNDIAWSLRALESNYKIEYISNISVEYPGQTHSQLKRSIPKYMSGIVHQHQTNNEPFSKRAKYFLKNLFPMKPSTFKEVMRYRRIDRYSTLDKCYLWLHIWQLKIRMAMAYIASSIFINE